MAAKQTEHPTFASSMWGRITHNWSWFDSIISGVMMLAIGYMLGWAASGPLPVLRVTSDQLGFILKLWAVFMFAGRGWQIARYPRHDTYKLTDLHWRHILHLNYVSWFHFGIAIIFAYSLAPEIGQVVDAWGNK